MNSDLLSITVHASHFSLCLFSHRRFELMNIIKQEIIEIGSQITFDTFIVSRLKGHSLKFQIVKYWTGYMLMIYANDMQINTALRKIIVGFNQIREISESCENFGFDSWLDFRTLFIRLIHFKLSHCFEGRCGRVGTVLVFSHSLASYIPGSVGLLGHSKEWTHLFLLVLSCEKAKQAYRRHSRMWFFLKDDFGKQWLLFSTFYL